MMQPKLLMARSSILVAVALVATLVTTAPTVAAARVSEAQHATPERSQASVAGIHSAAPPVTGTDGTGVGTSTGTAAGPGTAGAGNSTQATTAPLAIAQQHCQPSASDASDFSAEFNRRGPVWGGGDGAEPVPIDNGRTLWLFGDTYIGSGAYNGPLTTTGLVHNSMVVQYGGSCFAYLLHGSANHWSSAIADPDANDWYWPDSGAYDPQTGVLSIVATHAQVVAPGGQWGWRLLGVDVLHYRVEPSITLTSIERLFTYTPTDVAEFGIDETVVGNTVLFYGCAQSGTPACYVARTDLGIDASSLVYETADGWSTAMADAVPLDIDGLIRLELHVAQVGDGYVASNQIPVLSTTTNAWWAPTPTGPFSPIGSVMDSSQPPYGPMPSNWFTYGGRIIDTSAGPIGVFSVNTWDDEGAKVAGVYGPRFTAIPSSITDRDPFGNLESVVAGPDLVSVSGWALDPDTTDPTDVEIDVDGQAVADTTATTSRPDVALVFPALSDSQGFATSVPVAAGTHTVCATALNVGLGLHDTPLGCGTVEVGGNPVGNFEAVTAGPDDVALSGWALDPDTASSIDVHVYVDGVWTAAIPATGSRADVGLKFAAFGPLHGFSSVLPVAAGTHTICVYAINAGSGTTNPSLGCRTVVVGGNPFGNLESAVRSSGSATVSGWALDPDTASSIQVHLYVDGRWTALTTASRSRPDVGAAFSAYGPLHGFSLTFGVSSGRHTVCLYAINVGAGNRNPSLGCRTV